MSPFDRAGSGFLADCAACLVGVAWFDLALRAQLSAAWSWVLEAAPAARPRA